MPATAVRDPDLDHAAFRVLSVLCIFTDKGGECFPSLKTIAKELGISPQAVHRQIKNLERLGHIKITTRFRKDGSQTSSLYQILGLQHEVERCSPDVDTPSTPEVDPPLTSDVDPINDPSEQPKKNIYKLPLSHEQEPDPEELFNRWYAYYPKKVDKGGGRKAFKSALRKTSFETLLDGAKRYAECETSKGTPKQFISGPAKWLNGERWLDEYDGNCPASLDEWGSYISNSNSGGLTDAG